MVVEPSFTTNSKVSPAWNCLPNNVLVTTGGVHEVPDVLYPLVKVMASSAVID